MKTRIVWTKIHDDDWFISLTPEERYFFLYLITNQRIGHTGVYELSDRLMCFETGIGSIKINTIKQKLEKASKVFFYKGWIYVKKASFYGGYEGIKNKLAYDKEKRAIPSYILNGFKDKRDSV